MKQRVLAILLVCTLTVTVVFPVTVKRAFANSPGGTTEIYASELKDYFLELKPGQATQINQFFNTLDTALNESNNYVVFATFNDGDWNISIYTSANANMRSWYSYNYDTMWKGISRQAYTRDYNVNRIANLFYNGTLTFDFSSVNTDFQTYQNFWYNPAFLNYCFYPSDYTNNSAWVYTSRDIGSGNAGWSMAKNFFPGERPPQYETFDMLSFRLGDRYFLTMKDQTKFGLMEPVEGYWSELHFNMRFPNDPENEIVEMILYLDDFQKLKGIGRLVPEIVNPENDPVLGYDITAFVGGDSPEYCIMDTFTIYQYYETPGSGNDDGAIVENLIGVSETVLRFNIENHPQEPSARDDSWEQIINYLDNYDTTHIVPLQLSEFMSGWEGLNVYPAHLQVPSMFMDQNGDVPQYTAGIRYFTWNFSPDFDSPAMNFELMDVCIIGLDQSHSANDEVWQIFYFKDSTLTYPRDELFYYNWDQLIESFDIVLVVPEVFNGVNYDMDPFWYHTGSGFSHIQGFCGSGSQGITYGSFDNNFNVYHCYSFVTKKAIQKQQLYNLNDGIYKTYDLMSKYIEKHDKWDDSFLNWSMSVFNQLDSLNGYLDDIYKYIKDWDSVLTDISNKLDQIVNNTAPEDPGYWFISFFNWVRRFEPTNQDFTFWVESWDDYTEALPDPGSGVTVIPLPTAVPTVAVGG